jgi:hypothetical protein
MDNLWPARSRGRRVRQRRTLLISLMVLAKMKTGTVPALK